MPRYSFEKLGSARFEAMAQALLEPRRRGVGELIQFSPSADGGREATWEQPISHPDFVKLPDVPDGVAHKWVFQVKFHDVGARGWRGAADALIGELKDELVKITQKHKVPCHRYVLITNVVLSGVRHRGTRDKISEAKQKYCKKIPSIEVWDASDVSRMLDNNESVRAAYLDDLTTGDFLKAVLKKLDVAKDRKRSALSAYLKHTVEYLAGARAQEAGDEGELPLAKVYVDLSLRLDRSHTSTASPEAIELWSEMAHYRRPSTQSRANAPAKDRTAVNDIPASSALLFDDFPASMILAGPGYGKSTVTQFLTLYHAARLAVPSVAKELEKRLRLLAEEAPEGIGSTVKVRVPFKVELRRFAKWQSGLSPERQPGHLADYIASQLINSNVSSSINAEDIFEIAHDNPTLIVLDGLDEVPGKGDRERVMKAIDAFVLRCQGEESDIQLVLSSRPQGYGNEFEKYGPIKWTVRDLEQPLFDEYTQSWLKQRVRDAAERLDALTRLERGMKSPAVARLATTLLQATVMMTIVKRKSEVPHERHKLYQKYVDVIFDREREKWPLVSEYEDELRRLHELAGYELHKAVEAGQYKIIERNVFRGMVLRIWEQYKGAQASGNPLTKTVDEIIAAAANRLVFLSGKGEEQSDIDFVIQSFREYFAAQYIANHADADPARAIAVLVGRGFFWSNVLQFYIGLAKPSDQITWMHSCSQAIAGTADNVQATLNLIQSRRSLLQCLPEFSKSFSANYAAAIQIAFTRDTRWAWYRQDGAIKILSTLRPTESKAALVAHMLPLTVDDRGAFAVEADYCGAVLNEGDDGYGKLITELQKAIEIDLIRSTAISIAFNRSLEVSVASLPREQDADVVSDIIKAWRADTRDPTTEALKSIVLNDSQLIQLLCRQPLVVKRFNSYSDRIAQILPKQLIAVRAGQDDASDTGADTRRLPLAPYVLRYSLIGLSNTRDAIPGAGLYSDYLHALAAAAIDPTDIDKDIVARNLESRLPAPVVPFYSATAFLGPDQSYFTSPSEWSEFKKALSSFSTNTDGRRAAFQLLAESKYRTEGKYPPWILLSFSPAAWDLCGRCGIVSEEAIAALRATPVHDLLKLTLRPPPLLLGAGLSDFDAADHLRQITVLVRAVCSAAKEFGVNSVGSVPHSLLARSIRFTSREPVEAASELNSALANLPGLHTTWHALGFSLLFSTHNCPATVLVEAWQRAPRQLILRIKPSVLNPAAFPIERAMDLAAVVAASPTPDNLLLYAYVVNYSLRARAIDQSPLVDLMIDLLCGCKDMPEESAAILMRAVVAAPLSQRVLETVCSEHGVSRFTDRSGFADELIYDRLETVFEDDLAKSYSWLRAFLENLLTRRVAISPRLAVIATNILVNLAFSATAPLQDRQWQLARASDV